MLTLIGQPLAYACSSCGSAPLDELVSDASAANQAHAHHNMSMSSMMTDVDMSDMLDMSDNAASHDCCKDKQCSGSHCVSPSAFFSSPAIISFAILSSHVADHYQSSYLSNLADSPYKPPILG
ncbi:MAG: hypothetical protein P1U57_03275 [Oleibacter sp.]|nr:hypothetical protein [Thalassolituus sp.]